MTIEQPFYTFVREERQFCAILAHLLMQKGQNLGKFIELINRDLTPDRAISGEGIDEAEVYVEFTYLRDSWSGLARDNESKRARIIELFSRIETLRPLAIAPWPSDLANFNGRLMGERGLRITRDVAYPGHWTLSALEGLAQQFRLGPTGFRDLCRFKWAFNIKPDLVVVIPGQVPICIEAKLESKESSYPSATAECAIFDRATNGAPRVGQLELQRFMFKNLIGTECQPVVIVQKAEGLKAIDDGSKEAVGLLWGQLLSRLEPKTSIAFVHRFREQNEHLLSSYAHHRISRDDVW